MGSSIEPVVSSTIVTSTLVTSRAEVHVTLRSVWAIPKINMTRLGTRTLATPSTVVPLFAELDVKLSCVPS